MLQDFLRTLFQAGREASLVSYLLVDLIFHAYALNKEWLVLGKTALRDRDGCVEKDKALALISEKLTEQRIVNERATVTLDNLRARIQTLELDIARAEGKRWQQSRGRQQ